MRTLPLLRATARGAIAAGFLGLFGAPLAQAQDASRVADQFAQVQDLAWDDALGVPTFVSGQLRAPSKAAPADIAQAFLAEQAALLRVSGRAGFAVTAVDADSEIGAHHVRVEQEVAGVPVFGATSIVHIDRAGAVYAYGGTVFPGASDAETRASLSAKAALASATAWLPAGSVLAIDAVSLPDGGPMDLSAALPPAVRLVVYPVQEAGRVTAYRLAYHADLQVAGPQMARWQVFVDAQTGEVFDHFNAIHTAAGREGGVDFEVVSLEAEAFGHALVAVDGPTTGTGTSTFGGSKSLSTYLSGGTYYLYDTSRTNGYIRTLSAGGSSSLPGQYVTDSNNNWSATSQKAAVDAHWGAAKVYDYYKNTHGRNSFNGAGASITSSVNAIFYTGSGYTANNAAWNGSQMAYGDGDGQQFRALVDLDVCAHELTHAVTQYTANLIYRNESGALNEAMSDIMAVMVDRDDWTIGELSYTPGISGDALRSMSNPPAGDQPDNYAARYTGTGDNGGVHINSGIFNKAAYLMAQGGTFRGIATASIGRARTEKVWYRALTRYFSSSTGYSGARSGVLQATADLYGSTSATYRSVQNAFAAVGIGSPALWEGGGDSFAEGSAPAAEQRAGDVPAELALTGLFPNPTSGQATVAYALPQTSDVTLAAYDVLGRRVALLQSGQVEAGTHEASFDASALPAGLYVVQLRAGSQVKTERITVTR